MNNKKIVEEDLKESTDCIERAEQALDSASIATAVRYLLLAQKYTNLAIRVAMSEETHFLSDILSVAGSDLAQTRPLGHTSTRVASKAGSILSGLTR
jgi:hypothetical protein